MTSILLPDYGTCFDDKRNLDQENQPDRQVLKNRPPVASLIVSKYRTTSKHNNGLSVQEIRRLSNSAKFMERAGYPLFWAVLGDDLLELPPETARKICDRFLAGLVKAQGRAGYPKYWLLIYETSGGLHANVIFVGDKCLAYCLCKSFSNYMRSGFGKGKAMQPVSSVVRLAVVYLAKERTPQASYALSGVRLGMRVRGSHKLAGGGDRVKLSKALKANAIAAGAVEPWKVSNARRQCSL